MELLTRNNFEGLSNHIKDFKKEDIAFYKARIHNFFHK